MLQTRPAVRWLRMYGWRVLLLICLPVWLVQSVSGSSQFSTAALSAPFAAVWPCTISGADASSDRSGQISVGFTVARPTTPSLYFWCANALDNARPSSRGFGGVVNSPVASSLAPIRSALRPQASVPSWGARVLRALSSAISSTLGATHRRPGQAENL